MEIQVLLTLSENNKQEWGILFFGDINPEKENVPHRNGIRERCL